MGAVATVLALLLAGCASDAPADDEPELPTGNGDVEVPFTVEEFEDPDHFCVRTKDDQRIHAPDLSGKPWRLGQWWTYDLQIDDEAPRETQLVFYDVQDGGRHYMVGTPTREEALTHALFSNNPMIGRVHQALYSPHESGDHADMFHFPLCDGSSWETVFFGETFTFVAERTTLDLPDPLGRGLGFVINGTSPSGSELTIHYSPVAQWFTLIDLRRSVAQGGGGVEMALKKAGEGYTGPAHFLRGQRDVLLEMGPSTLLDNDTAVEMLPGRDGPYDTVGIHVHLEHLGGNGQYTVSVIAPDGTATSVQVGLFAAAEAEHMVEMPWMEGNWTVRQSAFPAQAGPVGAVVNGTVRLVSIYDRSSQV